jgi:isopentenyl phosphate kinase
MDSLIFIKFGGSIITDKRGQEIADLRIISRLARELRNALRMRPDQRVLLGHGSGSFGHTYAARYGVHRGLATNSDWMGYALTARAARRLHGILLDALLAARVPALSLQPSASLQSAQRELISWQTDTILQALERKLVPVIHGDVAFDSQQGSAIISTEKLFSYLALNTPLRPTRLILVGKTAIHAADPSKEPDAPLIPLITSANIQEMLDRAGGSGAVDVTGGMHSKLASMWQLVQTIPGLDIHMITAAPDLLTRAILGEAPDEGTHIRIA